MSRSRRILVVDDDRQKLVRMEQILHEAGIAKEEIGLTELRDYRGVDPLAPPLVLISDYYFRDPPPGQLQSGLEVLAEANDTVRDVNGFGLWHICVTNFAPEILPRLKRGRESWQPNLVISRMNDGGPEMLEHCREIAALLQRRFESDKANEFAPLRDFVGGDRIFLFSSGDANIFQFPNHDRGDFYEECPLVRLKDYLLESRDPIVLYRGNCVEVKAPNSRKLFQSLLRWRSLARRRQGGRALYRDVIDFPSVRDEKNIHVVDGSARPSAGSEADGPTLTGFYNAVGEFRNLPAIKRLVEKGLGLDINTALPAGSQHSVSRTAGSASNGAWSELTVTKKAPADLSGEAEDGFFSRLHFVADVEEYERFERWRHRKLPPYASA